MPAGRSNVRTFMPGLLGGLKVCLPLSIHEAMKVQPAEVLRQVAAGSGDALARCARAAAASR